MSDVIRDKKATKDFRVAEFRCRCRRPNCNASPMDPKFLEKLQELRDEWGHSLLINSGARCQYWNDATGGSPTSQHLKGRAADIHLDDLGDGPLLAAIWEKIGGGGIGLGASFIHVDIGPPRRWSYDS